MKILVDKVPTEPKECLFKTKKLRENEDQKFAWSYGCILSRDYCDFEKGHKCNKLKVVV